MRKGDTKNFISKREWLNTRKHSDNGWVSYAVSVDGYTAREIDAEFMIADCSRTITLNFSCYSSSDASNHAKKLDKLIDSLLSFRAAMGEAYEFTQNQDKAAHN